MKRLITSVIIIIAFPLIVVTALYLTNVKLQPIQLSLMNDSVVAETSYITDNKFYEITGTMGCIPGALIVPSKYSAGNAMAVSTQPLTEILASTPSYRTISSLEDIRSEEYMVDDTYRATVMFYLNLPSKNSYAIWFPSEFCEYRIYINGELASQSSTFRDGMPHFATSFFTVLPYSETGNYEVVLNVISPVNYVNTGSTSILIGTLSKIQESFKGVESVSLYAIALILFTIVYTIIQAIVFKNDRRISSFGILSLMTVYAMSFMDGRMVTTALPRLPYQLGVIMEGLSTPLYLLSLLYFTYTMFPEFFPKKIGLLTSALLIVPLTDSLMLHSIPVLNSLTILMSIFPYAICLYTFIVGCERQEKYILRYGFGLLSIESSVLLFYSTKDQAIPSRFAYIVGYIIFAMMMVSILANEFAMQANEEEFYKGELSRQLEAMQASENAFLNAQMKPHFLYNTLNTIADLCVTDPAKAKKLITSLSEYLKLILSMDSMDETVPLRKELEVVDAYTDIEKERFPSINFYRDYPVRMPILMVPPLTLQPLIENAIKHGVRKSDRPGVITLRIVETPTAVEFYVSDNGVGMHEDAINKLFNMPTGNQSIGIYNIDRRLKSKYGSGLHVESTPGLGTCVSFKVNK